MRRVPATVRKSNTQATKSLRTALIETEKKVWDQTKMEAQAITLILGF